MGKILGAYLFPHPPIIVGDIGQGGEKQAQKTLDGSKSLAKDIKSKKPSTIIIITPHGPLFRDAISISVEENLRGSFSNFGRGDVYFEFENNLELVERILYETGKEDITLAPVDKEFAEDYRVDLEVDHGALVPLYFVNKEYTDYKLIHITYSLFPPEKLYDFGKILQRVVLESEEEVVFIASGDLSHKLSTDGPYAYSPAGEKFDKEIVSLFKKGDFQSITSFDLNLAEKAGECGLRSLMVMAGFLDNRIIKTEVLSYEGPFGVGYCTGRVQVGENKYISLAKRSLEYYIKEGQIMDVPKDLDEELLKTKSGAFVTLKKNEKLRGCIGTIEPVEESLAMEIIRNAVSAGTADPRFPAVTEEELKELVYSVDVLGPTEKIVSLQELDVEKYGVIVTSGYRRGLLLPNLEGVDTVEEQIRIALAKAGIGRDEDYTLERFEVIRHI